MGSERTGAARGSRLPMTALILAPQSVHAATSGAVAVRRIPR